MNGSFKRAQRFGGSRRSLPSPAHGLGGLCSSRGRPGPCPRRAVPPWPPSAAFLLLPERAPRPRRLRGSPAPGEGAGRHFLPWGVSGARRVRGTAPAPLKNLRAPAADGRAGSAPCAPAGLSRDGDGGDRGWRGGQGGDRGQDTAPVPAGPRDTRPCLRARGAAAPSACPGGFEAAAGAGGWAEI